MFLSVGICTLYSVQFGNKYCVTEFVGIISASDENAAERSSKATYGQVQKRRRS